MLVTFPRIPVSGHEKPRLKAGAVNIEPSAEYALHVQNGQVRLYRKIREESVK